jgi:hypothetical protein
MISMAEPRHPRRKGVGTIPLLQVSLRRKSIRVDLMGPLAEAIQRVRKRDPRIESHISEGLARLAEGFGAFMLSFPTGLHRGGGGTHGVSDDPESREGL